MRLAMAVQNRNDNVYLEDEDETVELFLNTLKDSSIEIENESESRRKCGGTSVLCEEFPLSLCDDHHRNDMKSAKYYPIKFCLSTELIIIQEELKMLNQIERIRISMGWGCMNDCNVGHQPRIDRLETRLTEIRDILFPTTTSENHPVGASSSISESTSKVKGV